MYIHALSAFTEYLCDVRRSLDDIARFLILNTFKSMQDLQIYAIYIGKIENDGSLVLKSSFGFESKYLDQWQRIPLVKKLPITESITNEINVIAHSREEIIARYPEMKNMSASDEKWEGCIAVPVHTQGSFILLLKKNPNLSDEFELILKSIGHLLSMHLESTHHATGMKERVSSVKTQLTQRQEVICSFLEKGFTNPQIAEEIGYSESLIRQETIAIYSALQISGRKELIFKKL